MITEIVSFALPEGMTREEVVANFQKTAPNWRANPDLVRKNYLYDPERQRAGGVYLWRSREAAAKWHGEDFVALVKKLYNTEPTIQVFETPVLVDNLAGATLVAD